MTQGTSHRRPGLPGRLRIPGRQQPTRHVVGRPGQPAHKVGGPRARQARERVAARNERGDAREFAQARALVTRPGEAPRRMRARQTRLGALARGAMVTAAQQGALAALRRSKKDLLLQGDRRGLVMIVGTPVAQPRDPRAQPEASHQESPMQTLIVFSHLRWNFVYQRPQHLLSRLARHWRVVFIEEPMVGQDEQQLERFSPADGVEVWRPHVSGDAPGFHDDHISVLQKLIADAIRQERIGDYWIWFYTPMAVPLAAGLRPQRHRVRLHGRTDAVQERAAPAGAARERAVQGGRPGVHRRPEPVQLEEGAPPERALLPEQRRRQALLARAATTRCRPACRGRAWATAA